MKLRNRLIALVCLLLFLTLGVLLFLSTSSRKPFAAILFVGDNINSASLTAARLYSGGGDARLQIEEFPNTALCRNAASDFSVPESASASTQIASGKRVGRGVLGMDQNGEKLTSLLEDATLMGRSTGLITTGEITGTTAAAYYAKSRDAANAHDLLAQFCGHQPFDFVAGGGSTLFENLGNDANKDLHLAKEILTIRSLQELENKPFWKRVPVLALLSQGPLSDKAEGGQNVTPSLSDLVRIAIRNLQSNRKGYFLVIDDPSIAEAAASNDGEAMLGRLLAFDQAVATARHYAGDNALIVVTGRENIGGLQLNGYPFLRDKGVAVLALNNLGYPSLCWSTGPSFSPDGANDGNKPRKSDTRAAVIGILSQPAAFPLPKGTGVAGDVMALGIGQGSEKIHGFLDLSDLHGILRQSL
jgi:alkaline phosphatase